MVPVVISTNEVKCFWPRPPVPDGLVPGNAGGNRSLPGQRAPGGWREEASFLAHCRSQRLSSVEPEVVLHGNRVRSPLESYLVFRNRGLRGRVAHQLMRLRHEVLAVPDVRGVEEVREIGRERPVDEQDRFARRGMDKHNRVLSGGATNCSWHFSSSYSSRSALSAAGAFHQSDHGPIAPR